MIQDEQNYDAAVVGAGVVGLAAALALAAAGRSVAVVERNPPRRASGALGSDLRSVALTPASLDFLRSLGADLDGALTPISTMRVWEHDGAGALRFASADSQNEPAALAWVAANSGLAADLWALAAGRLERIEASLERLAQERDAVRLELADAPPIRAGLVVAADGPNSFCRRSTSTAARSAPQPPNGRQRAIATVARMTESHCHTAWQCFGRTGPVALLPLAHERAVSVIWSGAASEQEALLGLDDERFRAALEAATEGVAGGVLAVDERLCFPVTQTLAADLNPWPRVLLAGDAARTLHPLAGQGVNLGLEDARQIGAMATAGGDLGAAGRWRTYARERRRRSKLMMTLMRGLLSAYCGQAVNGPWLRWARNSVVRRIDASPTAKALLVREAMGLGPLAA